MIGWIAAFIAVFQALGALALTILFATFLRIPREWASAHVTLILPATGPLPGLEDLLTALAAQTMQPRRLIVAVESREDPAYGRVAAVAARYPELNIELVVAGLSTLRGQKCTNLLAALGRLDSDNPYVVLLDADIRPQSWWLAALVGPLMSGHADIVNGYRWQVPSSLSPTTALVTAIDRAIAVLPRLPQAKTIWGGSVGLTAYAIEILDLPATIGRTLIEDLPIGDRAAEAGLRVLTRRALRVPTPVGGGLIDLWVFGRRQYQLIRLYRPGLWSYAAFVVTTDIVARLVLVSAVISAGWFIPVMLALACLGSITTEIRLAIGRKLGVSDTVGFRLSQHLLVWMILPISIFHASVIWSSFVASSVRWAHIRYIVDRQGRVTEMARQPSPNQPR